MSEVTLPSDPDGAFFRVPLPDFEATWVGPNPSGPGFCLGSEDGRLRFTDEQFVTTGAMEGVSASHEAVNGVAHSRHWLAVTTRADINLVGPSPTPGATHPVVVIDRGAFGVAAAPSGHFIVPLGRSGIMYINPEAPPDEPAMVANNEQSGMNVCRVLALREPHGTDVIVCAGRRGGIGVTGYNKGVASPRLSTLRFDELDVVDVCKLDPATAGPVAAAARDGTIILFRDILQHSAPKTIKFRAVRGTVYRILSARGDLFLLTSQGLFVLANLVDDLTKSGWTGVLKCDILPLPLAAADANLFGERWLVAVGAGEVYRFDLEKLGLLKPTAAPAERLLTPECALAPPTWQEAIYSLERTAAAG